MSTAQNLVAPKRERGHGFTVESNAGLVIIHNPDQNEQWSETFPTVAMAISITADLATIFHYAPDHATVRYIVQRFMLRGVSPFADFSVRLVNLGWSIAVPAEWLRVGDRIIRDFAGPAEIIERRNQGAEYVLFTVRDEARGTIGFAVRKRRRSLVAVVRPREAAEGYTNA
jgi:hypothetical protein